MKIGKIQMFVRPESSRCEEVVSFVKANNLPITFVDITSVEGNATSEQHNILSLPTALVSDDSGSIVDRLYTLEEIKEFFQLK